MPIVKYKNQSGVIYAYDQTSSYDPEKKQSRPVRKYLGRVDPETGEIIPTKGKRGRPPKQTGSNAGPGKEPDFKALYNQKCIELDETTKALDKANEQINQLLLKAERMEKALSGIRSLSDPTAYK